MGGIGKKGKHPKKTSREPFNKDDKARKPPPAPVDDEIEDGDIATPKRDRYGNDDEPL